MLRSDALAGRADLAIIGGGAAATSFFANLVRQAPARQKLTIRIVDRQASMGRGKVFGADHPWIRMNTPAKALSLLADNPEHFTDWASGAAMDVARESYVSRAMFGDYIRHSFDAAHKSAVQNGHRVMLEDDAVCDLAPSADGRGYRAQLAGGKTIEARTVVVAVGPDRQCDLFGLAGEGNYIGEAYPAQASLAGIAAGDAVGMIGTGLTAVDVAITLRNLGHRGPVLMASRRGELPVVKGLTAHAPAQYATYDAYRAKAASRGFLTLRDMLRPVRAELRRANCDWRTLFFAPPVAADARSFGRQVAAAEIGTAWFDTIVGLQMETDKAWRHVRAGEIERFHRHFFQAVAHKHSAIPLINAYPILEWLSNGRLSVRAGLSQVRKAGAEFQMVFEDGRTVAVRTLINATGANKSLARSRNPLIQALVAHGLLTENSGGGLVGAPSGVAQSAAARPPSSLHVLGHAASGSHPFISNLEWLTATAKDVAQAVVTQLQASVVYS